ncbi:MAG TPA: CGNR zinc finger domain-containing protein [Solirubrobacteraceae bacterium]|jgi:predicted RNA-binding Zn ribbon-like protein|nr:CGNR zinc finger domain-containing protein [Solirubrobacteraceae bacterium]
MPITNPPHELDLVIDFVNTLDLEGGDDELAAPDGLASWLAERDLLEPPDARATDRELEQAVRLRESLRELMLANNGGTVVDGGWRELERAARGGELGAHFDGDGSLRLSPATEGVAGALAHLLVPVAHAVADATWERVKACRAPDCTWAFYDRSRNRSGVWCEMAVCGNRTKVRAYRRRAPRPGG